MIGPAALGQRPTPRASPRSCRRMPGMAAYAATCATSLRVRRKDDGIRLGAYPVADTTSARGCSARRFHRPTVFPDAGNGAS